MGRPPLNHAVVIAALAAGAAAAALAAARAVKQAPTRDPSPVYVDATTPAGGDGSAERPFKTMAAALESGRELRVAAGTYTETLGSPQDREGKRYLIQGGYQPGSQFAVRDPARYPTVLVGTDPGRPVIELPNADNISIDGVQIRGPGTSGILAVGWRKRRAITITNCVFQTIGDEAHAQNGAGAHLQAKTIVFANNRVENTIGGRYGGAVSIGHPEGEADAEATVRKNVIRRNTAVTSGIHGAGLLMGSSGRIDENVIEGNVMKSTDGSGPGGGVIIIGDGVRVTATRNLIANNRSETAGGGLFVDEGATAVLENNVVVGNQAGRGGSGIGVDGSNTKRGSLKLVNCTIAGNGRPDSQLGEGLSVENSDVEVTNTIFWGNGRSDVELVNGGKVALSCSNVTVKAGAIVTRGPGLTQVDPKFVAASRGDYALAPDSPLRGSSCPALGATR